MFEKFGEFDSYGEINMAAEGLYNEGDLDGLRALAKENGIEPDITDLYIQGEIPALCDAMMAAAGKLIIERADKAVNEYNKKIPADPIVEYLIARTEKSELAEAIRRKEKSLAGCLAHIEKEARKIVSRERPWLNDAAVYKMARDYYLGR